MPRHPKPPAPELVAPVSAREVGQDLDAANLFSKQEYEARMQAQQLAASFNYIGPLDPDALESLVTSRAHRTAQAYIELAEALILLKALVGHGRYLEVLKRHGLCPRAAQRMVATRRQMEAKPGTKALALTLNSNAKALEIAELLEPEELDRLADGEAVHGVVADDLQRLPGYKARELLLEAREKANASEEFIRHLTEENNELKRKHIEEARDQAAAEERMRNELLAKMAEDQGQLQLLLAVFTATVNQWVEAAEFSLEAKCQAERRFLDILEHVHAKAESIGLELRANSEATSITAANDAAAVAGPAARAAKEKKS